MPPKPCVQCLALQKTKNKKERKKKRKEGRKERRNNGRKEGKEKENMSELINLHKINTFTTEQSFHPKMEDF